MGRGLNNAMLGVAIVGCGLIVERLDISYMIRCVVPVDRGRYVDVRRNVAPIEESRFRDSIAEGESSQWSSCEVAR